MADSRHEDIVWQTAVDWIMRQHEMPLDAAAEKELIDWLKKNPANRAAYAEASHLWQLTGLVPRSDEPESGS